jgi:hypothetical protein
MEIGSFIELDIPSTGEFYQGDKEIARLNTARAGIFHALKLLHVNTIYLPYYLCPNVKEFLTKKGISIHFYHLNQQFEPLLKQPEKETAVLLTNYFGILSQNRLQDLSKRFEHVIVDNSQSFFTPPIEDCYNIYSARKFFGVPDGCYVIGKNAELFTETYDQDYSSVTAAFLLKRHEFGCNAVYTERMQNEERLDFSNIKLMSILTRTLLKGIDYERIRKKRFENFDTAHRLYKLHNLLDPTLWMTDANVPMVYPFMFKDDSLVAKLISQKIYTGRWWKDVLNHVEFDSFEGKLSSFMVPIPIDQRYNQEEINYCYEVIHSILNLS